MQCKQFTSDAKSTVIHIKRRVKFPDNRGIIRPQILLDQVIPLWMQCFVENYLPLLRLAGKNIEHLVSIAV